MSIISIRVTDYEKDSLEKIAELYGCGISSLIKKFVFERLEDEYDLKLYEESLEEYNKNPISYSLDEVREHCGLED